MDHPSLSEVFFKGSGNYERNRRTSVLHLRNVNTRVRYISFHQDFGTVYPVAYPHKVRILRERLYCQEPIKRNKNSSGAITWYACRASKTFRWSGPGRSISPGARFPHRSRIKLISTSEAGRKDDESLSFAGVTRFSHARMRSTRIWPATTSKQNETKKIIRRCPPRFLILSNPQAHPRHRAERGPHTPRRFQTLSRRL